LLSTTIFWSKDFSADSDLGTDIPDSPEAFGTDLAADSRTFHIFRERLSSCLAKFEGKHVPNELERRVGGGTAGFLILCVYRSQITVMVSQVYQYLICACQPAIPANTPRM